MDEKNSSTTAHTKEEASLEAPSSQNTSVNLDRVDAPVQTSTHIGVTDLRCIDLETLKELLHKKTLIEKEVRAGFASQAIPPGIYKENGKTYYVCPKSLFDEDNIIGQMIADFANTTGANIALLDTEAVTTSVLDRKFMIGLWFGMYSSTNQARRRKKQSYELGRTCTFSLIVKNMFESVDELGAQALSKDHFFFGNNPGEKVDGIKTSFYIKTKLRSFFDKPEWGDLIYGIINHTAAHVGFTNLTEEEGDKVVSDHLIKVDQVITSCYPTSTVKRGRQIIEKVRKPNPIKASPLYTRDEIEIISQLTSPIFTELSDLNRDFEGSVFAHGFTAIKAKIRENIRIRWETLQRFANRTKLRLQAIRKIVNNPTLRKAGVTSDYVSSLLASYQSPAQTLLADIEHILGAVSLKDMASFVFKMHFETNSLARLYILDRITKIYKVSIPEHPQIKDLLVELPSREPSSFDFEKGQEIFSRLRNITGQMKKNTLNLARIQEFKLFGRIKALESLYEKSEQLLKELKTLPINSSDLAIRLASDGEFKFTSDYELTMREKISNDLDYIVKVCKLRQNESQNQEIVDLLTKAQIRFQQGIDTPSAEAFIKVRSSPKGKGIASN